MGEGLLTRLIEATYAAPFEEEPFSRLVETCRVELDAAYVGFVTRALTARPPVARGLSPDLAGEYSAHYARLDPFCSPMASVEVGQTLLTDTLVSRELLSRSEFYNDFMKRAAVETGLAMLVDRTESGSCIFSVFHEPRRQERAELQLELVSKLTPHLRRALAMCRLAAQSRAETQTNRLLLERLPCAGFVVDRRRHLLYTNAKADDLLRSGDGIGWDREALRASHPADDRSLAREIESAGTRRGQGLEPLLLLRRPSGKRPLIAVVGPLVECTLEPPGIREERILVCVRDPEAEIEIPARAIAFALGTTPAEARLVEALVRGLTLKEAAERFGISEHTTRSQLKAVFDKTGTRSQSDLVRRVLLAVPSAAG